MSKISLYVWGLRFRVWSLGFWVWGWGLGGGCCCWGGWFGGLVCCTYTHLLKSLLIEFLMMLFLVTKGCKFDSCVIH